MTREEIAEINDEALLLDGFDDAIIGVAERPNIGPIVAYDEDKIIEILFNQMELDNIENMSEDDIENEKYIMAIEYYDYNIRNAWLGEYTPIYIKKTLY